MDILTIVLAILFVLSILFYFFKSKLGKYEVYVKYVIEELAKKADDEFEKNKNSDKHSWVAEKIYSLIPIWAKVFITKSKIDEWIEDIVHLIRQKQRENTAIASQVSTMLNSNITNDKLAQIADDVNKRNKVTLSTNINIADFKKSTIGINYNKTF